MARLLPFVLWAVAAAAQSNDSVFDVCAPTLILPFFRAHDGLTSRHQLLDVVPRVPAGWNARPERYSGKFGSAASLQRVRGPWTSQR